MPFCDWNEWIAIGMWRSKWKEACGEPFYFWITVEENPAFPLRTYQIRMVSLSWDRNIIGDFPTREDAQKAGAFLVLHGCTVYQPEA
jgi:hypothetical protein